MGFKSDVNKILNTMHRQSGAGKGIYGEDTVFTICENMYLEYGGILYHSYSYKTDSRLPGNIKKNNGLYLENLGSMTEIDVLLITPFRIFPIEVKAYKADTITLTDDGMSGATHNEKSPVHQNEMHCRHLLSGITLGIPDGDPRYIVPIVVFVDNAKILDKRTKVQRDYIKVTILNNLYSMLIKYNKPMKYRIDLDVLQSYLKKIEISYEKHLPIRYVERSI